MFEFLKRLYVKENSIFYSVIQNTKNNNIIAFGREKYNNYGIIQIQLDKNFNIIKEYSSTFNGEDPRCFYYNNQLYIQDNYFNNMHLINYNINKYIPINILKKNINLDNINIFNNNINIKHSNYISNISGKNISFISHKNKLYFIHYMKPFKLFNFDIESGISYEIEVDNRYESNYEYRGGTPGYKLNETTYYGFGHKTYEENDLLKHDIFKWILYFEDNKKPRILIIDIEQPLNSKNICDPTSVIKIDNQLYLITAESEYSWFCEQDYITNIYKIIGNILD